MIFLNGHVQYALYQMYLDVGARTGFHLVGCVGVTGQHSNCRQILCQVGWWISELVGEKNHKIRQAGASES